MFSMHVVKFLETRMEKKVEIGFLFSAGNSSLYNIGAYNNTYTQVCTINKTTE